MKAHRNPAAAGSPHPASPRLRGEGETARFGKEALGKHTSRVESDAEQTHILIIKHGALGDIILATAGFAAIRARHSQAHITCLTTKPYAELLAASPYFNEIWVDSKPRLFDRKAIGRLRTMLRSRRWAWVYDLQTSKRSTLYPWLLARPWPKISNVSRFTSHGYTDTARHGLHALENDRRQLALAGISEIGLPDVSWLKEDLGFRIQELGKKKDLEFGVQSSESISSPESQIPNPKSYALLVPGGAVHRPEKRWPAEQYAALAQELVARKLIPVLIGTQAEEETLSSIGARVPQTINLCGQTSLAQLASLARNAALAVGNDTGPMHVIAATGCPSLALFSHESNPDYSAPVGPKVQVLRAKQLEELPVDRVLVAVNSLLAS